MSQHDDQRLSGLKTVQFHLTLSQVGGVFFMEENVALDPVRITFFCAETVVTAAHGVDDLSQ